MNWYVVKIYKKGFPAGASRRENLFELCQNLRLETTGISGHGKLISGKENRLFGKNYKYQCVVVTRLRVQQQDDHSYREVWPQFHNDMGFFSYKGPGEMAVSDDWAHIKEDS